MQRLLSMSWLKLLWSLEDNCTSTQNDDRRLNMNILLTGAAGFIASCVATDLINQGHSVTLVDDFSVVKKQKNFQGKAYKRLVQRAELSAYFEDEQPSYDFVIHLGARTDTTDPDPIIFQKLNLDYSKLIWQWCVDTQTPLIYASSAATYGDGVLGFDDRHDILSDLQPLNQYAISKNEFDKWVLAQKETPPFWVGLKFFNVYGPNEYHKGRMASVIFHAHNQIKETGKMRLFRSHHPDFANGEQKRDFVYVKDVSKVISFFIQQKSISSGLYNLGTAKAETFNTLVETIFEVLNLSPDIDYIDTPIDIREKYQYFTQANMSKLHDIGYSTPFIDLKSGVADYVFNYLRTNSIY